MMSNVKNIHSRHRMSRVRIGGAVPAAEETLDRVICSSNSSVFSCALKVVMVVELFVTGDRELQTTGAMILNALDLKLILVALYAPFIVWIL